MRPRNFSKNSKTINYPSILMHEAHVYPHQNNELITMSLIKNSIKWAVLHALIINKCMSEMWWDICRHICPCQVHIVVCFIGIVFSLVFVNIFVMLHELIVISVDYLFQQPWKAMWKNHIVVVWCLERFWGGGCGEHDGWWGGEQKIKSTLRKVSDCELVGIHSIRWHVLCGERGHEAENWAAFLLGVGMMLVGKLKKYNPRYRCTIGCWRVMISLLLLWFIIWWVFCDIKHKISGCFVCDECKCSEWSCEKPHVHSGVVVGGCGTQYDN